MSGIRPRWAPGAGPLAFGLLLGLLAHADVARAVWSTFGGREVQPFATERLASLALSHIGLAALAIVPAALVGVALGLGVTRSWGGPLRPFADRLVAGAQAVPPVVVVALALPALGFGAGPTVLALALYGVMPILRGTVAALEAVPPDVAESARAIGLTPAQILAEVEWPLARPVVVESLRVSLVLCVATAAVGALAGAATLGTPIVLGLQNQNELYVLQGAAATAALAFLAEGGLVAGAAVMGAARLRSDAAASSSHPGSSPGQAPAERG